MHSLVNAKMNTESFKECITLVGGIEGCGGLYTLVQVML
jgi:hypothetical protein